MPTRSNAIAVRLHSEALAPAFEEGVVNEKLAQALDIAFQAGLLHGQHAEANQNAILKHPNPYNIFRALNQAFHAELLTGDEAQPNFTAIVQHAKPTLIVSALQSVQLAGLLIGDNVKFYRDMLIQHEKPNNIADTLLYAAQAGLLTGESAENNRDIIVQHQNLWGVSNCLYITREIGLFSGDMAQQNFEAIMQHQYPHHLANVLTKLYADELLEYNNPATQTRFTQLFEHSNLLFDDAGLTRLWNNLPPNSLTEETWDHLIQICRDNQVNIEAGQVHINNYFNQLLNTRHEPIRQLNPTQSTHTASVHQTVSESATRLKARYETKIIDLPELLNTIEAWVNAHAVHDAERRAIQQLVHAPYAFIDPRSEVSTKELIALAWIAIHDDTMRAGTLEDAQALFLQGLYDIQRAYNLSKTFEDRDGSDKKACASGTFNKFIEKLVGVHPDAELKYVTPQGALLKLLPLIREATTTYLHHHNLENLTLEALKEAVLPDVRESLFFEFGNTAELLALTSRYQNFEVFKTSDDYAPFQEILRNEQNEGLELMLQGKLLAEDIELDKELTSRLESAQYTASTTKTKASTLTQEEQREKRLSFFKPKTKLFSSSDVSEQTQKKEEEEEKKHPPSSANT